MSNKSYRNHADIRNMGGGDRKQLVKTEYKNYDEYMDAQKFLHDQYFEQAAETCTLCGFPMDYNGHVLTESEFKWSVHDVCKKKMEGMLDRQAGITRERLDAERRAERGPRRF